MFEIGFYEPPLRFDEDDNQHHDEQIFEDELELGIGNYGGYIYSY